MEKITQVLTKIRGFLTTYPKLGLFLFGFIIGFILGVIL
jgi:hypothetical protein